MKKGKFMRGAIMAAAAALSCAAAFGGENSDGVLNAVVKIESTMCEPDFISPWKTKPQCHASGTGVVINGNYILTNAHNVADATYISVEGRNDGTPFPARVAAVNHQCDLALVAVEDKSFFKDIKPLEIGETPPVQSQVLVAGYPMGGSGISVTQGIISRIETVDYAHWAIGNYLAAQLDAAVNPGNSGGPALAGGKVVGIVFQGNSDGDGLGYIIHTDIIRHFLRDFSDGKIDGFGMMQLSFMTLENPDTRKYLKMGDGDGGVMVTEVSKWARCEPVVKECDVISEIDGFKIKNNGNVVNERGENVDFRSIVARRQLGESVKLGVLRGGEKMEITAKLSKNMSKISPYMYDKSPRYFMAGGLVFTEFSLSYAKDCGDRPAGNISDIEAEDKDSLDEETIVLSQILSDAVNLGYLGMGNLILDTLNGKKIKNIKELAAAVDAQKDDYLIFEFRGKGKIILSAKNAAAARERIMRGYKLPSDRNLDRQ